MIGLIGPEAPWRADFTQKKGPEVIRALRCGGGGGNRTRVRCDGLALMTRIDDLAIITVLNPDQIPANPCQTNQNRPPLISMMCH